MADFQRYLARTEAWARTVEDDREDVVTTTGRQTAFKGDIIVVQKMRGEDYTYVMTADDFAEDWVLPGNKSTDATTSETGTDPLPETVPESTDGDNAGDNPASAVATAGTAQESPTPADAPATDETADVTPTGTPQPANNVTDEDAPPTPTASAPTGGGAGDTTNAEDNTRPDVGADTPDAISPVSGTQTPAVPDPAPVGSGANETTDEEETDEVSTVDEPATPDTTTPTQSVSPSNDPASLGTETTDGDDNAVSTDETEGGDSGNAPTSNVDNADEVNTGNRGGKAKTLPSKKAGSRVTEPTSSDTSVTTDEPTDTGKHAAADDAPAEE